MAKRSKPPIPLKLYKHFAVVTLALTATIAMFADSDQREARAEQLGEEEEVVTVGDVASSAPVLHGADEVRTQGSFGDEGGVSGGASSSPGGNGGFAPSSTRRNAGGGRISVQGYDQSWIDAMSEAEYEAFLEALPPEMREQGSEAERAAAFERAARRRSGHRTSNADAPG